MPVIALVLSNLYGFNEGKEMACVVLSRQTTVGSSSVELYRVKVGRGVARLQLGTGLSEGRGCIDRSYLFRH